MPARFLSPEQIAQYGRYAGEPSSRQLARYFHLDDADLEIMAMWREDHTRLGFAVQVCTVRFLGNFLSDWTETPLVVRNHLAQQLQVEDLASWQRIYIGSRTQKRHRHVIRDHYGYEEFHHSRKVFALLRRLYARAWLAEEKPLVLFDFATTWLVQSVCKMLLSQTRISKKNGPSNWLVSTVLMGAKHRLSAPHFISGMR